MLAVRQAERTCGLFPSSRLLFWGHQTGRDPSIGVFADFERRELLQQVVQKPPDLELIDHSPVLRTLMQAPHSAQVRVVDLGQPANMAGGKAHLGCAEAIEGFV